MNTKGTGASFRESMAWTGSVATGVAYAGVMGAILMNPASATRSAWLYGGLVFFLVVVGIVFSIIFSASTEGEPDDERDRAIGQRASRYSSHVLFFGVLLAVAQLFGQSIALDMGVPVREFLADPLLTAHALIFFVYASEVVRYATVAIDYRRGG